MGTKRCTASIRAWDAPAPGVPAYEKIQSKHCHPPRRRHANSRELYTIATDRATSRFEEPLERVREEAIRLVYPAPEDRDLARERSLIDQVIQRSRRNKYPREPPSLEALTLDEEWLEKNCPGLIFRDIHAQGLRALLLTSLAQLEVLSSRLTLFIDGTFKASIYAVILKYL